MSKFPTLLILIPLLALPQTGLASNDLSIGSLKAQEDIALPYDCKPLSENAQEATYLCLSTAVEPNLALASGAANSGTDLQQAELLLQIDDRSQFQRLSDQTTAALGELNSFAKIRLNPDGTLDTLTLGNGNTSIRFDAATLQASGENGLIDPFSSNVHLKLTIKIPGL